jgi:hypothetical protein
MIFWGFKLWVLAILVVAMLLLRSRRPAMLTWVVAWWLALFVGIRFGFEVPVPASVVTLYMAIATAALLVYASSSRERWTGTTQPIVRTIVEPRRRPLLIAVCTLLPLLVAWSVYARLNVPLEAPAFGRSIHPAPPDAIDVHDEEVDLRSAENPFRALAQSSPEDYARHLANGRRVYYQNCFYCHGDGLAGNGMFAHGLNPIPTNFTDSGFLPILQSSFVLWRVAKGGPGLPEEGGPWDSAMPAWEKFLTTEEMWDAILFLYDFTGFQPRAVSEEAHE